jgi:transcription termination factor NusB
MNDVQSLANQLQWCVNMKDNLNNLNREIDYVSRQYNSSVELLQEYNYISELLNQMQQMQQEFDESASDLIKHVESEHLSYVDKESRSITNILSSI